MIFASRFWTRGAEKECDFYPILKNGEKYNLFYSAGCPEITTVGN
jgi:hypothetical protein